MPIKKIHGRIAEQVHKLVTFKRYGILLSVIAMSKNDTRKEDIISSQRLEEWEIVAQRVGETNPIESKKDLKPKL